MADASAALEALTTFAADRNLDLDRVVAVGYEAGGQLAMSFGSGLAEPKVRKRRVHPAAVVGIAPISDLNAAFAENLGDGAIEAFLQGDPAARSGSLSKTVTGGTRSDRRTGPGRTR